MSQVPARIELETKGGLIMKGVITAMSIVFTLWFMGFWAWQSYELRRIANRLEGWTIDLRNDVEIYPEFAGKKK